MRRSVIPGLLAAACLTLGGCAGSQAARPLQAGVAAAAAENWDEAVRCWTKALEIAPNSAAAHNNLAVAYERRGAWSEAAKEYEAAVRFDPQNALIRGNYETFKARLEAGRRRRP
jgi:Tfp pilus assembly protein PilF